MTSDTAIHTLDDYKIRDTSIQSDLADSSILINEGDFPTEKIRNYSISDVLGLWTSNQYMSFNIYSDNTQFFRNTFMHPDKDLYFSSKFSKMEMIWNIFLINLDASSDLIIESLKLSYEFRNNNKVKEFIINCLEIMPLLFEIPAKLKEHFPVETLVLDIFSIPEEENWEQLIVRIQTKKSPEEARRRLKAFRDEWWFKASEGLDDKLFIHTEYV